MRFLHLKESPIFVTLTGGQGDEIYGTVWSIHFGLCITWRGIFYPAQMVLSRLLPVLCCYVLPRLTEELEREWVLLETHDSLSDWHNRFRTGGQMRRTLEQFGMVEIWCEYGGNSVEVRGKRPLL